ncbi:zinc finger BED domain-containing protein RICESLEEPER 2-like [Quillaja saponaria]|uniref:Zinc finger BED domain-containing protein RICESLEEPER 2-like n=1 Tax=Quillaja saponaria TaxID=32244 RepID=A0AAD7L3P4_QUISA|nr:zinc finger BED domain-containing protein RICESLEEPER 2-like [Quillaja saponaria]
MESDMMLLSDEYVEIEDDATSISVHETSTRPVNIKKSAKLEKFMKLKKSNVWKHFDVIIESLDGECSLAACKYCVKHIKCHSKNHGTSSLSNHLTKCRKYQLSLRQNGQKELGLKEVHPLISAIRNAVRYVRSSLSKQAKFKVAVENEKVPCKGLVCLDVPTRWNSTYLMLDNALKFQTAFGRLEEDDEEYEVWFKKVLGVTKKNEESASESEESHSDIGVSNPADPLTHRIMSWKSSKRARLNADVKTEVEMYLEEPTIDPDEDFDILLWWKANASKYKILLMIARDVLAIPVSTVASVSLFSTGGCVLDCFKGSLSPKTVEGLICLESWLSPCTSNIETTDVLENLMGSLSI